MAGLLGLIVGGPVGWIAGIGANNLVKVPVRADDPRLGIHPRALEARFQTCEAYYRLSPRPALDQEYTVSAMIHCQSIPEYYPGTEYAEQAQEYVVELRGKLAQKAYETGMFYFRRRAYDSAGVDFEDVVDQYADTPAAPAALGQLVETYTRIGYVEDAEEARERLLEEYPQSPEAQQVRA